MNHPWFSTGSPSLAAPSAMAWIHTSSSSKVAQRYVFIALVERVFVFLICVRIVVRRYLHFRSPGQKDHRLPGHQRQWIHSQRQASRRLRRGGLLAAYDTRFWSQCCVWLPQFQAHGAEEGMWKNRIGAGEATLLIKRAVRQVRSYFRCSSVLHRSDYRWSRELCREISRLPGTQGCLRCVQVDCRNHDLYRVACPARKGSPGQIRLYICRNVPWSWHGLRSYQLHAPLGSSPS